MELHKKQIIEATRETLPAIANLLQLYMYEFSAELGADVGPDGRFAWDGLEDYWSQEGLHPFMLTVDDKLAGFALVQRVLTDDGTTVWDIEDMFVMAKYRRSGLGALAARYLFRRFTGPWQIRVLASNSGARGFWRSAMVAYQIDAELPVAVTVDGRAFEIFRFRA